MSNKEVPGGLSFSEFERARISGGQLWRCGLILPVIRAHIMSRMDAMQETVNFIMSMF